MFCYVQESREMHTGTCYPIPKGDSVIWGVDTGGLQPQGAQASCFGRRRSERTEHQPGRKINHNLATISLLGQNAPFFTHSHDNLCFFLNTKQKAWAVVQLWASSGHRCFPDPVTALPHPTPQGIKWKRENSECTPYHAKKKILVALLEHVQSYMGFIPPDVSQGGWFFPDAW